MKGFPVTLKIEVADKVMVTSDNLQQGCERNLQKALFIFNWSISKLPLESACLPALESYFMPFSACYPPPHTQLTY